MFVIITSISSVIIYHNTAMVTMNGLWQSVITWIRYHHKPVAVKNKHKNELPVNRVSFTLQQSYTVIRRQFIGLPGKVLNLKRVKTPRFFTSYKHKSLHVGLCRTYLNRCNIDKLLTDISCCYQIFHFFTWNIIIKQYRLHRWWRYAL